MTFDPALDSYWEAVQTAFRNLRILESDALITKIACKWVEKEWFFTHNFGVGLARKAGKSAKCVVPWHRRSKVWGWKRETSKIDNGYTKQKVVFLFFHDEHDGWQLETLIDVLAPSVRILTFRK